LANPEHILGQVQNLINNIPGKQDTFTPWLYIQNGGFLTSICFRWAG